jgi:cytochrome c oxidase cbb3-type subunit II
MRMTPAMLVIGALMVFWASVYIMVFMPMMMMEETPSDIWRPWTAQEKAGHRLYVKNGCSYCHSQYIRIMDWDMGAERIAQRGDYVGQTPAILGTERTGPDLSQAGGEHPDDWHLAHFVNPRYTRPVSIMPSWEFLGKDNLVNLTAYVQALGGKAADLRVDRQNKWREPFRESYSRGPDRNIAWIHSKVPDVWLNMPNPYPATEPDLQRGKKMYQTFCINCHGNMGDGQGPAAPYLSPPPLNFTTLRRNLAAGKYIGGLFYYQIMNGITGTSMPYFKRDLESEKIWDISNYAAVSFIGYTDAGNPPRGIDAAYEPFWENTYKPPVIPGKE